MKQLIFFISTAFFSSAAFAQDTTGGTRPNLVIPLHKTPVKPSVPADPNAAPYTIDSMGNDHAMMTTEERRIRNNAAAKKKMTQKKAVKKPVRMAKPVKPVSIK